MTGPTAKGEASRREILAAAGEVFARHGYAGARMDEIVRATGMTKGAVYFHFPAKRELARAVVDEHKRRWLALAAERLDGPQAPSAAPERLRAVAELLVELTTASGSGWDAVRLANQIRAEAGEESETGPVHEWVELLAGVVERGQAEGSLRPEPSPRDAAVILVGAFDGLKTTSEAVAAGDAEGFARRARALLGLLIGGLEA
ncbi:MAG: helix-turn-helix domain-containing protein [Pseudoclavibacter sp.]|nr:helix-turn-helix domain-containing protein [Pseudoclavibacter sp.]